ncbi:MAG TPA: thiamine pyrophosphate-dependent enzyme, partial [Acidimicrobiia bacterium]|nr:thiamine pyrophosphate-dependent enzyme [Acidimicrobiia bacterium]
AGVSPNLDKLLDRVEVTTVGWGWFDPQRRAVAHAEAADWGRLDPDRAWLSWWLRMEALARQVLDAEMEAGDTCNEPRTARDTAAAVPPGGLLAVASSMPVRDLDWFASTGPTLEVVCNRGASGIDGLVSVALGAAAAGRGVVALAGDLSLLHDQNGFLVRPRPDLAVVVVNNDGGGIFSFLPQARFPEAFERLFGTPTGIDFAGVAATYRIHHRKVERGSALTPAISSALGAGGCHLIEVVTDRAENVLLHQRLTAGVVEAIEASLQG